MTASLSQLILLGKLTADRCVSGEYRCADGSCDALFDRARSPVRLADALLSVADSQPDRTAIVVAEQHYGYGDIARAIREVAAHLSHQPVFSVGSPVAMMLDNSAEYLAAFYGTMLAGGVVIPLPPNMERTRLARVLEQCSVQIALTTEEIAGRRSDLQTNDATRIPFDRHEPADLERQYPKSRLQRDTGRSLAMVLFTSGSSGDPKGVMLSDRNLLSNSASITEYLPIDASERALSLLPFYHAYGNSVLQTHLLAGATLVVDGCLTFPGTVIDAMRRHRITSFAGVPEAYCTMLADDEFGKSLPHLRYMTVAGGRLKKEMIREVTRRIAPAEFFVMYGQSEATARLAFLSPDLLATHPDSIGKPIPGVELRVLNEEGKPVRPGIVGELCARGPNIMLGYWNDLTGTKETLRGGWLRTGDLAKTDEEGMFYIEGRRNDLIKLQGMRTHPREVEDVVAQQLSGCRVTAVPYSHADITRLALFLVPMSDSPSVTVDKIREICVRELPRPKIPAHIEILAEFPMNDGMKVDRALLSRRAALHAAGNIASVSSSSQLKVCG